MNEFFSVVCAGLLRAVRCERGQTLVEYGLLLVLIAVVIIFMVKGVGQQANSLYCTINSNLGNVY